MKMLHRKESSPIGSSKVRSRWRRIRMVGVAWLGLIALTFMVRIIVGDERAAAAEVGEVRFTYVDVIIDSKGQNLAAWQVEVAAEMGDVSLVGVEAGEHAAYAKRPAYYDPAALKGRRMIVGDFSLDAQLPKGRTRVCRLMLELKGAVKPAYAAKVMAAADAEGKQIDVLVEIIASGS